MLAQVVVVRELVPGFFSDGSGVFLRRNLPREGRVASAVEHGKARGIFDGTQDISS